MPFKTLTVGLSLLSRAIKEAGEVTVNRRIVKKMACKNAEVERQDIL